MKLLPIFAAIMMVFISGCSSESASNNQHHAVNLDIGETQRDPFASASVTGMSDSGIVACRQNGGRVALSRQLDGSINGVCQFANGKRCNQNALMLGTCQ